MPNHLRALNISTGAQIVGYAFSDTEEDLLVFNQETQEIKSEDKSVPSKYALVKKVTVFNTENPNITFSEVLETLEFSTMELLL